MQESDESNLKNIKWDFENAKNWQTLLNDDSVVDFVKRSETPDELKCANISFCARYLDMPISWCKQFNVSNAGEHPFQANNNNIIIKWSFLGNMFYTLRKKIYMNYRL